MLTITSLAQKFQQLDTDKIVQESFEETKEDFKQSQKEQLKAGKTKTGQGITPRYRSPKYARVKHEMNPLPGFGTPDLYLTGAFSQGLNVEFSSDTIDIISTDEKGPDLEHKYRDIFGLGTTFKKNYLESSLAPLVREKISTFTGLSFEK